MLARAGSSAAPYLVFVIPLLLETGQQALVDRLGALSVGPGRTPSTEVDDPVVLAALERAVRRNQWIVVTGWSPHWMFGAYDLRYLDEGYPGQDQDSHRGSLSHPGKPVNHEHC